MGWEAGELDRAREEISELRAEVRRLRPFEHAAKALQRDVIELTEKLEAAQARLRAVSTSSRETADEEWLRKLRGGGYHELY